MNYLKTTLLAAISLLTSQAGAISATCMRDQRPVSFLQSFHCVATNSFGKAEYIFNEKDSFATSITRANWGGDVTEDTYENPHAGNFNVDGCERSPENEGNSVITLIFSKGSPSGQFSKGNQLLLSGKLQRGSQVKKGKVYTLIYQGSPFNPLPQLVRNQNIADVTCEILIR